MKKIAGNFVDILNQEIYPAEIHFDASSIKEIERTKNAPDRFILPGFIDAHVHIESSMLLPSEFARMAVLHGTVAAVSDPHEIGNVLGIPGVNFMIENGRRVPFKFFFGAPSCVPATRFESNGADINTSDIETLLKRDDILYLSEMMNWPGVVHDDPEVLEKLNVAKRLHKPVDGHAPGLTGDLALKYLRAGITTDHECITYEEAKHKITHGMKIAIREGSAARNFDALASLIDEHPDMVMLCSDDKHPDELLEGHINQLASRAVKEKINLFNALKAACINPVNHYNLDVGLLRIGDPADFIVVQDLQGFEVIQTWIDGQMVASEGQTSIRSIDESPVNNFVPNYVSESDLKVKPQSDKIRVIRAVDGQLMTRQEIREISETGEEVKANPSNDLLKLVVVNRYSIVAPAVAFIAGFGLKEGAMASSVGHDSHNITAVGCDDSSIVKAISLINDSKGGISAVGNNQEMILPLPFAGLMTGEDGFETGRNYIEIDRFAKSLGTQLRAPFMALSFMSLLVIPDLKLSDRGLFSGEKFDFVDLFISG